MSCSQSAGSQVFLLRIASLQHHVLVYLYRCCLKGDKNARNACRTTGEIRGTVLLGRHSKEKCTRALICLKPK